MTPDEIINAAKKLREREKVSAPSIPDEIIKRAEALRDQKPQPAVSERGAEGPAGEGSVRELPFYPQRPVADAPYAPPQEAPPPPGFFDGMSQLTPGNLVSGFMQGYEQMSGMMDEGTRALNAAASGAPFEYAPDAPQQQPPVDRSQMGWFPRNAYDAVSNLAPSIAAPFVERALPTAAVGAGVGGAAGSLGLGVGAVPGALAGAGTGATTGMTLGAYEMAVGDILQTMKQAGVDAGDAQMLALAYAWPYAALEMLQLGVAGKYALRVLKKSISGVAAKEITPEIAKNLVARAVKEGGKLAAGTASEIVAEGGQKGVSEAAATHALYNTGESERAADVAKGIPASMLQEMKDVSGPMLLTGGVGGSVSLAKGAASNLRPMDPLKVSREEWVEAGYDPLEHEKAYTEAMESGDKARIKKVSAATLKSYMTPEQPDAATETPPEPQTEPPADEETPEPPSAPPRPSGTRIPAPEEFDDPEGLTRTALDAAHPEGWTADDDTIEFLHAIETTRESWIEQGGDPEAHRRQVLRGIELGVPVPDEVAAPYYTDDVEEDVAEDPMAGVLPAKPDVEEVEARRVSDAQTYNVPPSDTSQPPVEQELPAPAEPELEADNAPDPVEDVAVPDAAVEQGAEAVVEGPPAGMPGDLGTVPEEVEAAPVGEPIVSNPPESETQAESLPTGETQPAPPAAPQSMVDEFQAVMDLGAHPPVYIPVKGLELSKEVPNFKKDADPETGEVEPLEGEFDDRGVAPIAVWRRTDGRLEVISGRHRLAHAKRNNRNSILSQVFNEADGFGADQAATLDAELNIRDGHGKVTDYGSYFRRAGLSKATARKRGLLRDTEARKGFTIGTMGSDDVFTSWENGAIETGPALAIVETAGADNAGQAIGLNLAISRPQLALDIPRFRETLKALLHMRVQGDSTMDMFGTETYDTAIEEAERRAAIAGRRQREIADKLAILKAGRVDRGKAAALGIDINVKDEAAVEAERRRLLVEAERWRDWPQHPDLVQQVVAEEQGVGEVNPQVDMTPAEVEVSDVEAAAEEAVVPVEKPKKRRGRKKDAPAPAPTAPSAGLGDAKEHLKKGFDEAIAGLDELFSKPDDQSTGGPARADAGGVGNLFDPAKYEAALPHLRKAWQEFLAAGKSVGAYYANIIGRYGKAIKPYLDKFVSEALGLSVARSEAKHVVARETQGGYLVSSKGLTKASFERFRDLCRENGGRYDSREKAWFFQSAEAVDRISEAIESFIARLEDQTTEDFAKVYEKKSGPVLKKTTLRSDEEYRAQVSDETKALLGKGREFGMTKEAVDGQAEDAGRILSAFSDGRKAFILANQAGSGKTFVLGAAIREMRARGVKRFVYYTMNQNLIRQIKRDLAEYGVDDITFATYSELQKSSEPLDDAVVIYDESHNIKNVKEAASAQKAKAAMPDARFVIFSSATPFESPTQAAYMAASGLFDAFGDESHEGFFCWACAHGATAKIVSRPGYRGAWVEEVVLEWSHKKTGDAKRANQSLRDMGVFQQRRVKLPKGLVSIRLKRVPTTDQALADIYNRTAAVFDALLEANPDSFIISSYRENLLKRITEAAKVDAAIAEAKRLLADGKNVVIFTETKSERQMGKFQSKVLGGDDYYNYPEMLAIMRGWGDDGPKPFSMNVLVIAGAMYSVGLDEVNLPPVVETLETALSEYGVSIFTGDVSAAKADQNKAAFMSGRNRVLIATMAKGGTGLSLHDQVGNRPTVQVALNLPWTASAVDQVSARTARQGLKSEAEIVWLFSSDLGWESEKLVPRVAGRMKSMGASVSGDVAGVAHLIGGHSDTDFDVSDMKVDEETESALKAVYEGTDAKLSAEGTASPEAGVADRDAVRARILTAVRNVARALGMRVNIQLDDRQDKAHIDGGYKDGTVYLNYAGIISNSRRFGVSPEVYVTGKLIHEGVIHHGFSFLSEKSRQHLTAWVEANVTADEINSVIPDMKVYRNLSPEARVEEYIARIAERARTDGALNEMQGGVWRRVVAAFRKAFKVKMNTDLAAIARTPAEVNKLVASLILDGGNMGSGPAKSTLRWSVESEFKKVRFVSVGRMARMMGDRPAYLDHVIDRMSYAHARLMNGEMTTPDVIRAYVITTASIQAGAMSRDLLEKNSGFRVDDEFCEESPSGVVTVRPEDAVAAWLMTEEGERAVANAARGNVDMKDWEKALLIRRAFGNASVMERMFATNLGGSRITMSNINELTDRLNEARTDPEKFHEALRDLHGVGFGKAPFIAHLLGLGTEPTVDAVEINAWLTGTGSVAGASERLRSQAAFLKRADVMRGYTHKAITKRVKQLAEILGQDIDPEIRATIIHHWLWDAMRGTETRHTALYLAMDGMRFSAEADVGNEPHLNAMPRLPKLSNLHPREARELHDGWIEKLEEWLEGAPPTMAFVDPDEGNSLILVSREAYQEGKWRQTFWHKSGDGWVPGGHITFDTRLDAVRDAAAYGVDYDPHILFSAEAPDGGQTETPAFKKWFGDSKVVDKDGKPLVVYHGTPDAGFSEMETPAFFSSKPELAEEYTNYRRGWVSPGKSPGIVPVFLRVENPLEIDARGARNDNIPFPGQDWKPKVFGNMPKGAVSVAEAANRAKDMGHDGLIVRNTKDSVWTDGKTTSDVFVVFSPNQIKSATGNSGAFSGDTADIRYSAEIPESTPVMDAIQIYGDEQRAADALIRQVDVQLKSKQVPRRETMATIYTLVTRIPKEAPGRDKSLSEFWRVKNAVQVLEAKYRAEANAEQSVLYEVDPTAQQGFLFSIEDTSNGRPDHGMAVPELVELAESIIGEGNITVARYLRPELGGVFIPGKNAITIRSDMFAGDTLTTLLFRKVPTDDQQAKLQSKWGGIVGIPASEVVIHYVKRPNGYIVRVIRRNHTLAAHVLAHEIGHAEDNAPGPDDKGPTMGRGRILGRIAKLRQFTGQFLGIVTADERKTLRKQAERDAKAAGFNPKQDKDAYNQAVRDLYQNALSARLQATGTYNEMTVGNIPGIRAELEALTQWWRGLTPDQMDAYLKSGEELYADMISVLLNQPEEFEARCPQTYRALGEFFAEHQEMRDTYTEIQKDIHAAHEGNPEALLDRRLERLRRMMVRDEDIRRKVIDDRNAEMPRMSWRRFWQDIVRIIQARDVVLPNEEARMAFHDTHYIGGRLKQYHRDVQSKVVKVLDDAGVNLADFGLFLSLRRAAFDEGRRDLANFQGTTDESAQQALDRMREVHGDQAFNAMDTAAENLADIRERHIFPALAESGLVDDEFLAKLRANRYYSTFQVAKYFAEFGGSSGTKLLYKQFGSVHDIMNPFYATMATDAQIMWAASNNHAKMKTVEGLRRDAPGDIYEPKWTFMGGKRTAVNDKNTDLYGLLEWREGKDVKAAIVPLAISELYKHNPTVAGPASAIFFAATSILKRVMTTNNPAFGLGNLMMDFHRTYMNVPTRGFWDELLLMPSLVMNYVRSLPDAFQDAFLKRSTPLVRDMYEKGLLIPGRTFSARQESGLETYQRIQKEWDLDVSKQENFLWRVGRWVFDDFNQSLERLSKIAGYRQLKDSGMSDLDIKRTIRGEIGSPDFLQGGSATPVLNSLFLFSNAGVQSLASFTGVAKRRPITLGLRIALSVVAPKMIMAYFASGTDDDDDEMDELARRYGMIPDRDKAHRMSFPNPLSATGYFSFPQDRTVDPIATAVWAAMGSGNPNAFGEVKRSALGVLLPFGMDSLNSYIDVARAAADVAMSIPPYDYFRGQPIIDRTTWEAGGFESAKELGKWAYNEIVGSKIGIEFERPYSVRQSKASSVPLLAPFIRRFYRDSDFGIQEQEMFKEQAEERDAARARMPVKRFIADTVRGMEARDDMSPSEVWGAAKEAGIVPEGYKYSTFKRMLTTALDRRFGEK